MYCSFILKNEDNRFLFGRLIIVPTNDTVNFPQHRRGAFHMLPKKRADMEFAPTNDTANFPQHCRDRRPREPPKLGFARFGEPLPRRSAKTMVTSKHSWCYQSIRHSSLLLPEKGDRFSGGWGDTYTKQIASSVGFAATFSVGRRLMLPTSTQTSEVHWWYWNKC